MLAHAVALKEHELGLEVGEDSDRSQANDKGDAQGHKPQCGQALPPQAIGQVCWLRIDNGLLRRRRALWRGAGRPAARVAIGAMGEVGTPVAGSGGRAEGAEMATAEGDTLVTAAWATEMGRAEVVVSGFWETRGATKARAMMEAGREARGHTPHTCRRTCWPFVRTSLGSSIRSIALCPSVTHSCKLGGLGGG